MELGGIGMETRSTHLTSGMKRKAAIIRMERFRSAIRRSRRRTWQFGAEAESTVGAIHGVDGIHSPDAGVVPAGSTKRRGDG